MPISSNLCNHVLCIVQYGDGVRCCHAKKINFHLCWKNVASYLKIVVTLLYTTFDEESICAVSKIVYLTVSAILENAAFAFFLVLALLHFLLMMSKNNLGGPLIEL